MPTGFHPNPHFFPAHLELAVELLRFLAVPQFPLVPFTSARIDKRNLLEARVIVTTYNDHVRLVSPEPWLASATKVYSGVGERSRTMIIIGVDFHPEFQQIASVDTETGEFQEKRLAHREDAETFYRALAGQKVRDGMEASGHARWFERLLTELQLELWIGDAAEKQSKRVRKQKTDRQDAQLILRLMLKDDFPQIWVPSWENRDLRQLLWHRHRMVQVRTRIMNQLHVLALNEGCGVRRRCGDRRGEPNCSRWCWRGGPADVGKTCWSYWIN